MASATGANGRVGLTTKSPSLAMETELRLRLTSRTLVSFLFKVGVDSAKVGTVVLDLSPG